jgi:predicted ATPase
MRLSSFAVENYKSFPNTTRVELTPLTLFFGYNSVGKSALIRLIPLLAFSAHNESAGGFSMSNRVVRSGSFSDFACKLTSKPEVSVSLTWDPPANECSTANSLVYTFTIRELSGTQRITEAVIELGSGDPLRIRWDPDGEAQDPSYNTYSLDYRSGTARADLVFSGIRPIASKAANGDFWSPLRSVSERLAALAHQVHWLEALRIAPARMEMLPPYSPRLASDGSGASAILAADDEQGGELLRIVSAWYESATGSRLTIQRGVFRDTPLFSTMLVPSQNAALEIPLIDTGEGMGQVISILTLLAQAATGKLGPTDLIVLEHPELHLHPQAHVALAELICRTAATESAPNCIVETHSENILLSVQLSIVKRLIRSERVVVYWVRQTEDGRSSLECIKFDDDGYPMGDNWPNGVFREASQQARELQKARLARSAPS